MALSFIVIFLYGSMVWGVFPREQGISWESHLLGSVSGILLAFYYRKEPLPWIEKVKVFKFEEYYPNDFWNNNYYNEPNISSKYNITYEIKDNNNDTK